MPAICSLSRAASRISLSGRARSSRIGSATLSSTVSAENSALLEQHTPAVLQRIHLFHIGLADVGAEDADLALGRTVEAEDLPHQRGLAGTGAAHQADDFTGGDAQVKILVDHHRAELGPQLVDLDNQRSRPAPASCVLSCVLSCVCYPSEPHAAENDGEDGVGHDHNGDRGHHRGGGAMAQAFRYSVRCADRNSRLPWQQAAEHGAFAEADQVVGSGTAFGSVAAEVGRRQAQLQLRRRHPAQQGDGVGPDHQQGIATGAGQYARQKAGSRAAGPSPASRPVLR